MKKIVSSKTFQVGLIIVLVILLALVVVFGKIKQNKESRALMNVLGGIEQQNKLSKDEESKTEVTKEVQEEETETGNKYTYKGSSSIGTSDDGRWKNKKWLALGDNITARNSYQYKVKISLSMSSVTSDASIGRLMGDAASNITSDKLKNVDLVTVFAGTSDYSLNTPLGTINDDESKKTFYGGLHKTINKLLSLKPDAAIVFFTPLKRGAYKTYPVYPNANEAGVKLDEYAQAIEDVCKSYNILVLDLFNDSGINEKNIKSYTTDNLHLNSAGSARVTKLISDYLKTVK